MPTVEVGTFQPPQFSVIDYIVVAVYMAGMLACGWRIGSRVKSTRAYFIAEGKMGAVVVGLSLLGAYLSAYTMMGFSGNTFRDTYFNPNLKQVWNLLYTVQLPFLLVTAVVMTRVVLPRYRAAGVISVYQFLERRIHVSSRMLATASFLALAVGRMGLTTYLPALALHTVAGWDLTWTIVAIGGVVTVYTMIGGIEAVIWTDVIQVVILTAGALVSLGYVIALSAGGTGVSGLIQVAAEHGKFRMFDWNLDWKAPVTAWFILETLFQTVRIYGTQQDMTQRYMATGSTKEANKSVWISILGYIPLAYLFYFTGIALFVYYVRVHDPNILALARDENWDAVYPYFVVSVLPAGLAGLVVSAILAAAMSTVSALLNSASTVCVEDFYRRFARTERSDASSLTVAKALTVVIGVLGTITALGLMGNKDAAKTWNIIMAYCTNGVLALMAAAFLPIRIRAVPAVGGFLVGGLVLYWLRGTAANFLLYAVVGNTAAFVAILLLNAIAAVVAPLPRAEEPGDSDNAG